MTQILLDVELFGIFSLNRPARQALTLSGPLTAGDVALLLGLKLEEIGLIVVDGVQTEPESHIVENCRVCFFPPISGG